jgi:2-polyprenyl-6-methoxyphenol hydroxylase-like FAD-dependent oxidoreductase/predicted DsbA family dithiol-disulfide isomerase
MKTVIIGGGIAGMAAGAFLQRNGMEIVICEKQSGDCLRGHAFLMHKEALSILNELAEGKECDLPGETVNRFILRRPDGNEVRNELLDSWRCIKRSALISFLHGLLPAETIKNNRDFSHFIQQDDKIVAAVFLNGEVEYGDIFIGADGGNSRVREKIFGKIRLSSVAVKEIVGVSNKRELVGIHADTFVKFQDKEKGLAFGVIPTAEDEFVWFMQYDPCIADLTGAGPEDIRRFCTKMLRKFPALVKDILRTNDFTKTYIWNTKDFDLLPSFHNKNVVLLGDAAHLTLPFTSAGTTNAIIGAKTLSECLNDSTTFGLAFETYYQRRSNIVEGHIALGRNLSKRFLHPLQDGDNYVLPFLSAAGTNKREEQKILQVRYFTDPICSTCWIFQPLLKKIHLEYGQYLDIQYYMGGLLPSWNECKGKIRSPSDAAKHWNEIGDLAEMPLDGDVWIEDPLSSSFPPSIAFKAAQMQDRNKAILFLRRIREMVFLEKKNIVKWKFIWSAALEVGLDLTRFLRDYNNDARLAFEQDLLLAKELNITSFPTLILSDGRGRSITLKGYQQCHKIEHAILELIPHVKKEKINREPKSLFGNFPTMVDFEFALLSNLQKKDAIKVLQELKNNGYIERLESKNGSLWKIRSLK